MKVLFFRVFYDELLSKGLLVPMEARIGGQLDADDPTVK